MDAIKRRWPWLFLIIALGAIIVSFERCRTYREDSQDKHIIAAARKYGVDPALVNVGSKCPACGYPSLASPQVPRP